MEDSNTLSENPYNNTLALKELIKMMKRKEKITVAFVVDEFCYASTKLDSKTMSQPFILQMSEELYQWLMDYLVKGEITLPIPDANKDLLKNIANDSNELATNTLINFLNRESLRFYMHITPEIADKPNRLTVKFGFPYGMVAFKVKRDKEILDELTLIDF